MTLNKNLDTLTTGLYYRKNIWNESQTMPVILKLNKGVLSAKTDEAQLFSIPIDTVKVRFSMWGRMFITVDGKRFEFTRAGAITSPVFTKAMLNEIEQDKDESAKTMINLGLSRENAKGVANTNSKNGVGTDTMVPGYFYKAIALKLWRDVFTAVGIIRAKR
jgi:hypothetical protein